MGTVVSIAIHTEQAHAGEAFEALLKRLSTRGEIVKVTVEGWVNRKLIKKMPKAAWTSGDRVFVEDEIAERDERFYQLIQAIPTSNQAIQVRFLFYLLSQEEISFSLYLYGKDYDAGVYVRDNSSIMVSVSMNDVDRPLRKIATGPYFQTLTTEQLYADETIRHLTQQVTHDWAELFLVVCGIDREEKPAVQHAAMYLENGWPSPACCAMLFHRDKREFAKDFLRIFRVHNLKKQFMNQLLANDFDLERDVELPDSILDEKLSYYQQFDFEDKKLSSFLESLEVKKVRRLANFSEVEISAALSVAGEWAKEHEFDYSTVYVDFTEKGSAILSTPTTSIWRLYEYMYHLV